MEKRDFLKLDQFTQLAPVLEDIARELGKPEEAAKWNKILSENFLDTISSVKNKTSREWAAMGVPLRVLNELRKREKATDIDVICTATPTTSIEGRGETAIFEQSFKDLSRFIKPSPDIERKRGGSATLRRLLNKRSNVHYKHRATVNIIGRESHQALFIKKFVEPKSFDRDCRAFIAEVVVYGQEIELEIHDCSISQSEGPSCLILTFSINNYQSLTKMMDKWIETIKTKPIMHPILLVGLDLPCFGVISKLIPSEKIREIAEEMNVLRYFEVRNKEDATEVFHEAARISFRDLHSNFRVETIERLHQACEKRLPSLDLRKRGIVLLPSVIYYLSHFLQKIQLDNNNFKYFPMEILAFVNLQELSLSMNQIEEIPPEISKLTSLVKLDLENNLIEDIPILSLKLLKNLTEVKLKGNPLSKVPEEISKGKDVNTLPLIISYTTRKVGLPQECNIFGVELAELIALEEQFNEPTNRPSLIPRIIRSGLNFIFRYGIGIEGIFRVAGQNVRCTKIKEELKEKGSTFEEFEDPHNVSTVIKQWLRDLPAPAFLFENFDKMLSYNSLEISQRIESLRNLILTLPKENYHLLRQLFRVMYNIANNSSFNKMDDANITKVIGPNLLFSNSISNDPYITLNMISNVNEILTTITKNYPAIFELHTDLFELEQLDPRLNVPAILYRKMCAHEKSVVGVCVTQDSNICSADSKGFIRIWSLETFKVIDVIETQSKRINSILRCGDNFWVSTSTSTQVISGSTKQLVEDISILPISSTLINGNVLFDDHQSLSLYSGETFKLIARVEAAFTICSVIEVENQIWIACTDQKIRICNINTLEIEEVVDLNTSRYFKLLLVRDCVWIFCDDSSVLIFDYKSREVISKFEGSQKGKIFGIALVHKSVWISDRSGDIVLYNIDDYSVIGKLYSYHTDALGGIVFVDDPNNPLHTRVFTASWDKSIICWIARDIK